MKLRTTFGADKPIIAMVHFPPLPGSPLYDAKRGMNWIIESASKDIAALQKGGVDAVMFGNEGDRPYILKATPESLAAYAAAVMALKSEIKVPFGVNYLWDPVATVGLAVATGAKFGREIMTGVYDSDMGIWAPDCAGAVRLRHNLGRDDIKLMYNINAEFASPMGTRTIAQRAKSAVFASLADVVLVSGQAAKDVLPDTPVFANTGVNLDNVQDILKIGDGVIIGTHFKKGGDTWKAVDGDRVKRFMDKVRKIR
jgi:membrane complex biogenesis BtpA family protein